MPVSRNRIKPGKSRQQDVAPGNFLSHGAHCLREHLAHARKGTIERETAEVDSVSKLIYDFTMPVMHREYDIDQLNTWYSLAIIGWNIATLEEPGYEEFKEELRQVVLDQPDGKKLNKLLDLFIEWKHTVYGAYPYFINDFEVKIEDNTVALSTTSMELTPFPRHVSAAKQEKTNEPATGWGGQLELFN